MSNRRSIEIDGLSHLTAIPVASKIGPLLVSSVIAPFNPGTRDIPDDLTSQFANVFRHIGLMLEDAGGTWSHVAKIEFWAPPEGRNVVEPLWVETFPDPASRPARHSHITEGSNIRASFVAYIEN